jgi:hypothetical protein
MSWFSKDRRPDWVKKEERALIDSLNNLKTLHVSPTGMISLDPEELEAELALARKAHASFVDPAFQKLAYSGSSSVSKRHVDQGPVKDATEIISWRRVSDTSSIRYVCLQDLHEARYAVATACLFKYSEPSVPECFTAQQIAVSLAENKLEWHGSITVAMDSFDRSIQSGKCT